MATERKEVKQPKPLPAPNSDFYELVETLPAEEVSIVKQVRLHRIEQQSERFQGRLDSALDHSRLEGTAREDDINAFIKEFNNEVKRLRDRSDDHKSVAADVQSVLDRAARIDEFMSQRRLNRNAQEEWARLKTNLDELAQAYSVDWRWR
jgi:outer membrane murein-binding lipoprotein Lpp